MEENEALRQEIQSLKNLTKRTSQIVDINEHFGVIHYLFQKEKCSLLIQASDTLPPHSVEHLLTFDNSEYWNSGSSDDVFIIFQFLTKKIKMSKYLLRGAYSLSLRNWKLEGSGDGNNWETIDGRSNQFSFTHHVQMSQFDCQSNSFYSHFKLTHFQTRKDFPNMLGLSFVEFGGEVMDL
jgi:mRNA-degrading endonuclease YafQ of YafQ-DinJ toxin-antitoxin module